MRLPERRLGSLSLSLRLLLIVALSMGVALFILVNSVLHEVDHEAEEVLDAWQFIVASDLLRDVMAMIREERLNEAWLALETTRGLENSWLSRFSSSRSTGWSPVAHRIGSRRRRYSPHLRRPAGRPENLPFPRDR